MSNRPYLFIDFDDTMVDSLPVVVDIFNKKYNTTFTCNDVNKWDLTDCWPDLSNDELNWAFECDEFWNNVDCKKDVFYSLQSLQYLYNIYVVSKGTTKNLNRKQGWIDKHLRWNRIDCKFIPIELGHSKGEIPMPPRSIMIDDNERYLDETQATIKILYETYKDKEWNKHWNGMIVSSWYDLYHTYLHPLSKLMNGGIIDV